MEIDHTKPHYTTTSELFICFTSRLSHSSSMRHSSKSILSPSSITTVPTSSATTLTTSLSRRLRGGAQSPAMFPSSNKKSRGPSAFSENPEPSSPKVTCIGQVRVKTKKQGKKMKLRACRKKITGPGHGPGTETSFRPMDPGSDTQLANAGKNQERLQQRNQRWVHLPLTICEALRGFGNEVSCLLPCKSSCFSNSKDRENGGCGGGEQRECNNNDVGSSSSCGAVCRWLVSLQEGEVGKRRDIELVVGDDVEERERDRGRVVERECSRRRSIFDDMEFDDLFKDNSNNNNNNVCNNDDMDDNDGGRGEEKGRVSVCVPPKNALLLMRCRSDPVKMASLSQKYWEPAIVVDDGGDDDDEEEEEEVKHEVVGEKVEVKEEKLEVREVETEEVGEESVKLEVGSEVIEMCEDLVGFESLNDDLGVCGEEQVLEEGEEEKVEYGVEKVEKSVEEVEEVEQDDKGVIFEETYMIEDEIQAIGSVIELVSAEEECKDVEIEQDLVDDDSCGREEDYERAENEQDLVNNESCCEEEKFEDAQNEQDLVDNDSCNQGLQMEEEELERVESSEGSSCSTVTSSSDESTTESEVVEEEKHTIEEEKHTVEEVKVIARKSVEKSVENDSKFEENEQKNQSNCEEKEQEFQSKCEEKEQLKTNKPMLPDCLLLMMCEPKLSMEVSKETWVCSTDFVRWLPDRHPTKKPTKTDCCDDKKKVAAVVPAAARLPPQPPAPQPAYQPGRSSISFPASGVADLIEQKLAKGVGYEPFALTRCKSAPHRSTAKILGPELACSLWGRENGRKLEPHRQATCGVGTAGVGF